jgi:glycosyltransferase involved in cell wall biosynthesis
MIIGNGSIANRFASYGIHSDYLVFAGSLHNSSITDGVKISEEEDAVRDALDLANNKGLAFVYFSSCSIDNVSLKNSPYVSHKAKMEQMVRASSGNHLIFRLPQIIGLTSDEGGLFNELIKAVTQGDKFKLWQHAIRNFIDLDDVYSIVHEILSEKVCNNQTINVANPYPIPVIELVKLLERFFGKQGNYELSFQGESYPIDISAISNIAFRLNIDFGDKYLLTAIDKYYGYLIRRGPFLLSVIVPTYNQEQGINEFYRRTKAVLNSLQPRFKHEIIFVNDHSADNTFLKLRGLAADDPAVKIINFARNFGNQIAITAGVHYCRGNIAVIIDDDLQDPPEIILDFLVKWSAGYKVVYGVRPKRQGINPAFKLMASFYYRLIGALSDTKIPNDTGDFRLVDRVVIDQLRDMKEENRYYRGMVAWVGFRQTGFIYQRDKRYAGTSNFSVRKYINFALNGLTSFTDKPLYFSSLIGFFITAVAFFLLVYIVINKFFNPGESIRGWTSLVALVMFFGGIQLFSIGVVGLYISKIYREVKKRPLFIVQDLVNIDEIEK